MIVNLGPVNLNLDYEGTYNPDCIELPGRARIDIQGREATFKVTPMQQKAASKNIKVFGGDVMNCRLQKSGAYGITARFQKPSTRTQAAILADLLCGDVWAMLANVMNCEVNDIKAHSENV